MIALCLFLPTLAFAQTTVSPSQAACLPGANSVGDNDYVSCLLKAQGKDVRLTPQYDQGLSFETVDGALSYIQKFAKSKMVCGEVDSWHAGARYNDGVQTYEGYCSLRFEDSAHVGSIAFGYDKDKGQISANAKFVWLGRP